MREANRPTCGVLDQQAVGPALSRVAFVPTLRSVMETAMHNPTDPTFANGGPRAVQRIYPAPAVHWVGDGFRVAGYFNVVPDAARRLSPFLLLDYHAPHNYPATTARRGVGPHPHRGFETVTLAWQGSVAHHDSTGSGGVIGPGDVQWMTAGSGLLHQEYHDRAYAERGGPFQMAQLWINLPKAHKMDAPRYQAIVAEQMGLATLPDGAGSVRVIAGEYQGVKGPAKTFTPVNLFDVRLRRGGSVSFLFTASDNVAILIMSGDVSINAKTKATTGDFVVFENTGDHVAIEAASDAHLLVLNGEPIDEPVVQHGPFVMNTEREIHEAIMDFRMGKFGRL
jgi:redox-sensitive bicupin YhaK (pirin superfamily)